MNVCLSSHECPLCSILGVVSVFSIRPLSAFNCLRFVRASIRLLSLSTTTWRGPALFLRLPVYTTCSTLCVLNAFIVAAESQRWPQLWRESRWELPLPLSRLTFIRSTIDHRKLLLLPKARTLGLQPMANASRTRCASDTLGPAGGSSPAPVALPPENLFRFFPEFLV